MRVGNLTLGIAIAIGIMNISSCTSDDDRMILEPADSSVISFNAIVPHASRGEVTTTANIKEFAVTAYTGGKKLMDNVLVTRDGIEWTYSPKAYWPDTPVNFYAVSPNIENSPDISDTSTGTANINGYNNPGNVDLLYAVNIGEIQRGAPVNINFRHAMSRIVVKLSSTSSDFTVKVNKVIVGNVFTKGSFCYPRSTTSQGNTSVGTWHYQSEMDNITLFAATGTEQNLTLSSEIIDLSESETGDEIYEFFLPQELGRLSYNNDSKSFTGTYISIDCEVFDKTTGSKLFPGTHTPSYLLVEGTGCGRIMYPVTNSTISEWKSGYTYIYNIAINDPSVLLDGIGFGVTVDEFVNAAPEESPAI